LKGSVTTGRIEPANAAPTLLNDKLPALLYVIEEAFGPDIALFLHRFVIKGKEARAVVLEMAGCVLSGHAWPARPFPGIIRSGRSLMAVDRSDRMADGVQRHISARERSVHLFISKYIWTVGGIGETASSPARRDFGCTSICRRSMLGAEQSGR
jgi:hypothetical protein